MDHATHPFTAEVSRANSAAQSRLRSARTACGGRAARTAETQNLLDVAAAHASDLRKIEAECQRIGTDAASYYRARKLAAIVAECCKAAQAAPRAAGSVGVPRVA